MRRNTLLLLSIVPFAFALAGCGPTRVAVDARLTPDAAAWSRLDGPVYRIVAMSPQVEASLEFQEAAAVLESAMREFRPDLHRVTGPPGTPGVTESVIFTLGYQVIDRGTAVESYPVYGPGWSRVYVGCRGIYHGYCGGYAGQAVEAVHLGFVDAATVSAWVPDPDQPAGRFVVWEGTASLLRDDADRRRSMPYLMAALAEFYGRPTEGRAVIKFKHHDVRVECLGVAPAPATQPAATRPQETPEP